MISVVLPCKDEEKTIAACIRKAKSLGKVEIIVVDNNSIDDSASIAKSLGAIVIKEKTQGYGAALKAGFKHAHGEYILMADADDTYDIDEARKLLKYKHYDIVLGERFKRMKKGSMTLLHKFGNRVLSYILRTFFDSKVKDAHSGFRLIKKSALERLNLESNGMEIASEMLLKAARLEMKVKEVQITYHKRQGISKIKSLRDGWKHLRLMLLYSPDYLYLVPGILLFLIGMAMMIMLLQGPIALLGFRFSVHPMFIGSLLTILGYQIILLWLFARIYLITYLDEHDKAFEKFLELLTLERGVILGIIVFTVGLIINIETLLTWMRTNYGQLDVKMSIFGLALILLGLQTVFSSFYLSIIGMKNEQKA